MQAIQYQLFFHTYQFVLSDDGVVDFAIYNHAADIRVGDVYLARVSRCDAQFCFLDIAQQNQLFIRKKDIASTVNRTAFKQGDLLYVQVNAAAHADKAARATGHINLSSSNLILVTDKSGLFISQKITDQMRRSAIKTSFANLLTDDFGLVVRTSAEHVAESTLLDEAKQLIKTFQTIIVSESAKNFQVLRHRPVDTLFNHYCDQIDTYWAKQRPALKLPFNKGIALYQQFDLLAWLKNNQQRRITMTGGVELVIEELEALTVVDINSTSYQHQSQANSFAYAVNMVALSALPAELNRRKISGTVIVDCLTMERSEQRQFISEAKALLKAASINLKEMTASGFLELSIQHSTPSVKQSFYQVADRGVTIKSEVLIDYWLDYMVYQRQISNQRQFQFAVSRSLYYLLQANQAAIKQLLTAHDIKLWLLLDERQAVGLQPLKSGVATVAEKKAKIIDLIPFV
ncbi:MAG: hypothetical protein CSA13_01715 [Clostridiales bacterium]|nr:MAG: hypothetical protein CSA13_01715 [Clostridiales bacterium]